MPITIKGIRIKSLSITTKPDQGECGVTSDYELLSSEDRVLASQSVGGYNGLKVQPAADTVGALNAFIKLYKRDINTVLGLESE